MQSKTPHVRIAYEAAPCGYGPCRQLVERGFECMVYAPSLIPQKHGDLVKTDRRDEARACVTRRPMVENEAFQDLARAWATSSEDLRQAKQGVKSFLFAHSVRYAGRGDWSGAHKPWLGGYSFGNA